MVLGVETGSPSNCNLQLDLETSRTGGAPSHRRRPIRVLFVHRDAEVVHNCQQELEKAQFVVTADVVLTLAQCAEQLHSHSYDVVVAEYPGPNLEESQTLQLLHQTAQEIPLLFVITAMGTESVAQLAADGSFDYVEREQLARLPMAVRRALNETKLRAELEDAEKALRHSQSLYRALVENPAYGICRCDAEGKILEVNQAFVAILGYATKAEFLATDRASEIIGDLGQGRPLAGRSPESVRIEPTEINWKRDNGTVLRVRLSGRGIFDERGDFAGLEIIAVDVTEQRALEDHLRPRR
jgi:PAS domain S-box-containing protein